MREGKAEPSPAVAKTPESTGLLCIPEGLWEWAGAAAQRVQWLRALRWWRRGTDQVNFSGTPWNSDSPTLTRPPCSAQTLGMLLGWGRGREAAAVTGATSLAEARAPTHFVLSCLGSGWGH